jgi:hypothetical protein
MQAKIVPQKRIKNEETLVLIRIQKHSGSGSGFSKARSKTLVFWGDFTGVLSTAHNLCHIRPVVSVMRRRHNVYVQNSWS